jgi:hypothetical protein
MTTRLSQQSLRVRMSFAFQEAQGRGSAALANIRVRCYHELFIISEFDGP